jgi:hypothetical protein
MEVIMNQIYKFSTLVLTLSLAACSISTSSSCDVNQDKIHQSILAQYTDTNGTQVNGRTYLRTRFRFDDSMGNTLELCDPSVVTHDTFTLTKSSGVSSLLGTYYSFNNESSNFDNTHTFTFEDTHSKSFVNEVTIVAVDIVSTPTTISQASGAVFNFSGGASSSSQEVALYISSTELTDSDGAVQTSTSTVLVQAPNNSSSVTVTPANLAGFTVGTTLNFQITRTTTDDLAQGTSSGGERTGRYLSKVYQVTLNP